MKGKWRPGMKTGRLGRLPPKRTQYPHLHPAKEARHEDRRLGRRLTRPSHPVARYPG